MSDISVEHLKDTLHRTGRRDSAGVKVPPVPEHVLLAWENLSLHPDFSIVMEDLARLCCFTERAENMLEVAGRNIFIEILTRAGISGEDVIKQIAYGRKERR